MKAIFSDRTFHPGRKARHGCGSNKIVKSRLNRLSDSRQHTILVPMDFTKASDRALDYALSIADGLEASVVVLHVVERIYAEGFLDTPAKSALRTEAHDEARKRLDAIVERKSDCSAPIKRIVCRGMPQPEILRFAESMGVDLIVLGRRRRTLLGRWVWGSVSDVIVDIAPCPVLVVKQHEPETHRFDRRLESGINGSLLPDSLP